jgi:hypothetical protein
MPANGPPLEDIFHKLAQLGCDSVFVKVLAKNDNTKNQPYLSKSFEGLHLLPHGELGSERTDKGVVYKASVNLSWLDDSLRFAAAPESKLILYPQYPEVRLSGFLRGCETAPSELMRPRKSGYTIPNRIMILGVNTSASRVYGYLAAEGTLAHGQIVPRLSNFEQRGVLFDVSSLLPSEGGDTKKQLLDKLLEIHRRDWIISKRLDKQGNVLPCLAPNCGGFTLEAELEIRPNSRSEPDFLGWEVKQHGVTSFANLGQRLLNKGTPVTLMTPEPTGGYYVEAGVARFIREYGYPDRTGKEDRLNFGGKYVFGVPSSLTRVRLWTNGFDAKSGKMDGTGSILLVREDEDRPAAEWSFSDMLRHWSRKHAKAVYVPSMCRREGRAYKFANVVRLGEGTDFIKFLRAVHGGFVYYDPGIKLENASGRGDVKRRSQFRILSGHLPCLYDKMTTESLPPST